jgi:hypothetical protein
MFLCDKGTVWMKRRSGGEIDGGHGILLHEKSKVVLSLIIAIDFWFKICILSLVLYEILSVRQRR